MRSRIFVGVGLCLAILGWEPVQGVSRLAFSRPGQMMRVPMSSVTRSPYLFSAGFVSEVVNFAPYNSATGVYFDSEISNNFRLGLSSVTTADTSADLAGSTFEPPLEIGIHFQQRIWTYGNISFSLGLQDIVLTQTDGDLDLEEDLVSFLGVISSEQNIGEYRLNSYMGFSTGALAGARKAAGGSGGGFLFGGGARDTTSQLKVGGFAGFLLNTPILADRGGLEVIGEYDGTGVNLGVRVPITSDYRVQFGLVHVESLGQFGAQGRSAPLAYNAPAAVLSLDLSVPRIKRPAPTRPAELGRLDLGPRVEGVTPAVEPFTTHLDSTLQIAEFTVAALRDSLRIARFEIDNLYNQTAMLEQQRTVLTDSVRHMQLRTEMMKSNMNYTMRHLTASWTHFYQGNYRDALEEVEMAIQLNPDLAIAYARRGSIYYKLGDIQRATINWNLALKLDPEYDDVRNVLRALKENRLSSTSLIQQ